MPAKMCQSGSDPRSLAYKVAANKLPILRANGRVGRKRVACFEIFYNSAEINRLGIKRLVFGDLRAIQHSESVTLEHLFPASAFESDDLSVNALLAAAVEITQIRA